MYDKDALGGNSVNGLLVQYLRTKWVCAASGALCGFSAFPESLRACPESWGHCIL